MHHFSGSMITVAIATAAASAIISATIIPTSAQGPAAYGTAVTPAPALKTPWGEPDLQGIWTDETDTPLQRSPRYANQGFFTAAQREELDRQRSALLRRDKRVERGTELDVAGAYNGLFQSYKHTGIRTSLIVDPPKNPLDDARGAENRRCRSTVSTRLAAGDRDLQVEISGMQRRQV